MASILHSVKWSAERRVDCEEEEEEEESADAYNAQQTGAKGSDYFSKCYCLIIDCQLYMLALLISLLPTRLAFKLTVKKELASN